MSSVILFSIFKTHQILENVKKVPYNKYQFKTNFHLVIFNFFHGCTLTRDFVEMSRGATSFSISVRISRAFPTKAFFVHRVLEML